MKVVFISDTHEKHERITVPDGDVLVFAGDATMLGEARYLTEFNTWLGTLPHPVKVGVLGNHDMSCDPAHERYDPEAIKLITNMTLLCDSGIELGGLKFWGSPYQPEFHNWGFQYARTPEAANEHWRKIPNGLDVLITHGPPLGILDKTHNDSPDHLGCPELRHIVEDANPKVHVFGHIHGGAGTHDNGRTLFINAAVLDEAYMPTKRTCVWETQ